jgi:hypothetical protein
MAFDAHKNLAISTVATAPSPATSGTSLTVAAGEGARFPAPPFNATAWPANAVPTPANAEVLRVTALAGDVLTVQRAQEGTTARAIGLGDLIAASITAKVLQDLEQQAALKAALNIFTTYQEFAHANPALKLRDTTAPTDSRLFDITNAAVGLHFRALNDADSIVTATPLALTRTGDAKIGRNIYERGRPAPLGHPTPWTPTGTTAEGAAVGGTITARFTVIGQTVLWYLSCIGFTVPASTASIRFTLPPGYPPAYAFDDGNMLTRIYRSGAFGIGYSTVDASQLIFQSDQGPWAAGASHILAQGFYFTTA